MNVERIVTKVVFRKFRDQGAEYVVALFPEIDWGREHIASYMHVGQHGGALPGFVDELTPAMPEEYMGLHEELLRIGYTLEVVG